MKIVNIKGGLGNQMFQYALAYKLKKAYPSEIVYLCLKDFKGYTWHSYELKYVFNVDLPIAGLWQNMKVTSPFSINTRIGHLFRRIYKVLGIPKEFTEKSHSEYSGDVYRIKGDCFVDGYWANQDYFADVREEILDIFSFKRSLDEINQRLLDKIQSTNSVSLHVRRGNYLLFDIYKGICELDYYQRAVEYINANVESPHFYIFSNDINWCEDNLTNMFKNYTFVGNNSGMNNYIDMQLMSKCKHNIIANSTFSWWGAWLNQNDNRIVVAPQKWLNLEMNVTPILKDWKKM